MENILDNYKFIYNLEFNLSGELQLTISAQNLGNNELKTLVNQNFATGFFENYKLKQTVEYLLKDIKLIFSVGYLAIKYDNAKSNINEEKKWLEKLIKIQKKLNANKEEFLVFVDNCLEFNEEFLTNDEQIKNIYLNYLKNI